MHVNLFAAAVPNANRDAYIAHAARFAEIIRKSGCTRYVEVWADDVPDGELTSFIKAVQCNEDESVVVGWGEWPDKETCARGMKAVMADPVMADMKMPFDGKRLIFGEFTSIIEI